MAWAQAWTQAWALVWVAPLAVAQARARALARRGLWTKRQVQRLEMLARAVAWQWRSRTRMLTWADVSLALALAQVAWVLDTVFHYRSRAPSRRSERLVPSGDDGRTHPSQYDPIRRGGRSFSL